MNHDNEVEQINNYTNNLDKTSELSEISEIFSSELLNGLKKQYRSIIWKNVLFLGVAILIGFFTKFNQYFLENSENIDILFYGIFNAIFMFSVFMIHIYLYNSIILIVLCMICSYSMFEIAPYMYCGLSILYSFILLRKVINNIHTYIVIHMIDHEINLDK